MSFRGGNRGGGGRGGGGFGGGGRGFGGRGGTFSHRSNNFFYFYCSYGPLIFHQLI